MFPKYTTTPPSCILTMIILTLLSRILLFEILYAVRSIMPAEGYYDAWISKVPCSHTITRYSCIHRKCYVGLSLDKSAVDQLHREHTPDCTLSC